MLKRCIGDPYCPQKLVFSNVSLLYIQLSWDWQPEVSRMVGLRECERVVRVGESQCSK